MHLSKWSSAALAAGSALAACDAPSPADLLHSREEQDNGLVLNSAVVNGEVFNGWQLNGGVLNGWQLNGWQLNGWQLNGVSLAGTMFTATATGKGKPHKRSGLDLIGSEITLSRAGVAYKLRIDDIYHDPDQSSGDVYFYAISVYEPATKSWSSLCEDDQGQPTAAIPLKYAWDPDTGDRLDKPQAVTLACRGAVLAKCVEWGYRPWATRKRCSGQSCSYESLRDAHQACTRMARADYCGDGTPHTFNGTPIDIYDKYSPPIQKIATLGKSGWKPEAEWGPDGAVCVGDDLRLKMFDELDIAHKMPPCLTALDDADNCGTLPSWRGGKVASRYCSKWKSDPDECDLSTLDEHDD
jgi:hypothetical protein